MNIFYLDQDPILAAKYHIDKHVNKMFIESVQILSTVLRLNGYEVGYKITHKNHPCVRWAADSRSNFKYLCELANCLYQEFRYRYNKDHKTLYTLDTCMMFNDKLTNGPFIPPPQCMPEDCKQENTVQAYRDYYIKHKQHIKKYTNRDIPYWWRE